ncbi:MAG: hypothetical protein IIW74_02430, partial [Rikenellaceae bacterium]|nr:hypothetical protein [Rikenellaceae bacterium]
MKRLGILLAIGALLLIVNRGLAQELDGHYYPFGGEREHLPEIDPDSTLFYIPVAGDGALFDRLTRYAFSSVRFARRGVAEEAIELDGVRITRGESYLVKRLLRTAVATDGMASEMLDGFS